MLEEAEGQPDYTAAFFLAEVEHFVREIPRLSQNCERGVTRGKNALGGQERRRPEIATIFQWRLL
jgi:hypothetical protein